MKIAKTASSFVPFLDFLFRKYINEHATKTFSLVFANAFLGLSPILIEQGKMNEMTFMFTQTLFHRL